jgi:hypothetical protein
MTDAALEKTEAPKSDQPAQTEGQQQPRGRRWTGSLPQIAGEHCIDIGNGRYAHFRRDRRFAQVQVMFTAPEGVDPNPGRELTDQFKEQGWTWQPNEPGKPWIFQLEQSTEHDPTARADSHAALHEQFLIIIQEYRQKHGMPLVGDWASLPTIDPKPPEPDSREVFSSFVADQGQRIRAKQKPRSEEKEARAGGVAAEQALGMLDAFASAGAQRFDLTFTDAAGEKVESLSDKGRQPALRY